jgi:hypothetical protein
VLIAQLQQQAESGSSMPRIPLVDSSPEFHAPTSARWINGLWFLSLLISLTGALLAIVSREWLVAFTDSRPRAPHAYALLHQARLAGVHKWGALHIIDLLPTILQCAVFLFAAGLVVYLWTLDHLIASIVGAVSLLTLIFYVTTTVAVAFEDFCPFVTQTSKYLQRIKDWAAYADKMSEKASGSKFTTYGELEALRWLSEHTRDPDIGESVHQAIAGLRLWRTGNGSPEETIKEHDIITSSKSQINFMDNEFDDICKRLPELLRGGKSQISARLGLSLAKYANALPQLAQFFEHKKQTMHRPAPDSRSWWNNFQLRVFPAGGQLARFHIRGKPKSLKNVSTLTPHNYTRSAEMLCLFI